MPAALRADPDLFDLDAWLVRLEELRDEDAAPARIAHVEAHISALMTPSNQRPAQAR